MQFTRELMKIDDQRSLILWVDGNDNDNKDDVNKFVVCSYYDPAKPIGQQWCWGHYFNSLYHAMDYVHELRKGISYMQLCEIAETAVSWIDDNGYMEDYQEDRDIQFTDKADEYFGVGYTDDEE